MTSKIGVLFVCTGNICRSPTAEAVFRHKVRLAGLETRFLIDSAGTHGYHTGDPPDPRAIATALERGVDMRDLRARKVETQDFDRFNHIYAMDRGHYAMLDRLGGAGPLSMFLEENADVPDPYYGGQKDFDRVFALVDAACDRLLAALQDRYLL